MNDVADYPMRQKGTDVLANSSKRRAASTLFKTVKLEAIVTRHIVFSPEDNLHISVPSQFTLSPIDTGGGHGAAYGASQQAGHGGSFGGFQSYALDIDRDCASNPIELHGVPVAPREEILYLISGLTRSYVFPENVCAAWSALQGGALMPTQGAVARSDLKPHFSPAYADEAPGKGVPVYRRKKRLGFFSCEELIDRYHAISDPALRVSILSACRLVDRAKLLATVEPSAAYNFLVTAMETMMNYEIRNVEIARCDTCGQRKYHIMSRFKKFVGQYSHGMKKQAVYDIYLIRTTIAHQGGLLSLSMPCQGDYESAELKRRRLSEQRRLTSLLRMVVSCLASFLFAHTREDVAAKASLDAVLARPPLPVPDRVAQACACG